MWAIWWGWLVAGVVLAIAEIFVPGFIFLGFAIGAVITGVLMVAGGPLGAFLVGSLPATALIFAVLSLIAWIVLRRVVGVREGQVKVVHRDINED